MELFYQTLKITSALYLAIIPLEPRITSFLFWTPVTRVHFVGLLAICDNFVDSVDKIVAEYTKMNRMEHKKEQDGPVSSRHRSILLLPMFHPVDTVDST